MSGSGPGGGDTMEVGGSVNREPGSYIYIYIYTLGIVRSKKIGCTLETAGSLENFNLSRKLQSNALGSEIVCFLLLLVLMCVFYWF